jgi:hypothetical protein
MNILATALLSLLLQVMPQAMPIQGVVLKKGTVDPLGGATVELRLDLENSSVLASTTTEDDGRFFFGNVAPGRYRLTAARRGYTRAPLAITLASGQPAQDIRLNMTATAAISGRIIGPNGRPMGNVEVRALKASYPEGRRVLTPVQSAATNDLGEYRLFWLTPGRYYVSAVHPKAQGMFRRMASGVGVSVSGPSGAFVTIENSDPAIRGLDPVTELETAAERYAPIFFGGTTDEQRAAGIDLREAADFSGVDIVVAPVQLRHVRGVIVDGFTGKPAQYGSITLPNNTDSPPIRDPKVDRDTGAFDMLLFPGSYTVTATSASGEGYATFTLGDADIDLTIPTTLSFNIRGKIVIDGEPLSPAALEALRLSLRRDPAGGESVNSAYTTPLADGSFTIDASSGNFRVNLAPILNVTASRYEPPAWRALQNAYVKSIRLGNADVLNAGLRLDRAPSASLEVVIATNPGALEGQLLRNGREPVADALVLLIPDNRRRNELYRTTTTDPAGRFLFNRVPPGDYKVFSWAEVEDGAWHDAEFMKGFESRGLSVHISEGLIETARIEIIP